MALLTLLGLALGATAANSASSGSTTISVSVPSSTTLDISGCPAAARSFGPVTVSSSSVAGSDCAVTFGSSNDTAALRVRQTDQLGTAMARTASAYAINRSSIVWRGVARSPSGTLIAAGYRAQPADPLPISTSSDGGTTWTARSAPAGVQNVVDIDAPNSTAAYALGSSQVFKSSDDGVTWTTQTLPVATGGTIDAVDLSVVWAGGGRAVVRTINGGATWTRVWNDPNPDVPYLRGVTGIDASTAFGYGLDLETNAPFVIRTTDAGATWTRTSLAGIGIASDMVQHAGGRLTAAAGSRIIESVDDGASWSIVATCSMAISRIDALDATHVVGFGTTGACATTNGTTYSNRSYPVEMIGAGAGVVVDAGALVAVGYGSVRARSDDYGLTWATGTVPPSWLGAAVWNAQRWWLAGYNGQVSRTDDAGTTWTPAVTGVTVNLADIDAGDADAVWAVGAGGAIVHSTDGGATWTAQSSGVATALASVAAASPSTAWAVGAGGRIVHTSDGGASWTTQTSGTAASLNAVSAASEQVAYAVGTGGTVLRTVDGGATWTPLASGTTNPLFAVAAPSATRVYIGGARAPNQPPFAARSTDGTTFGPTTPFPSTNTVVALTAPSEDVVWALSETQVARSVDGGITWVLLTTPALQGVLKGLGAADATSSVTAGLGNTVLAASTGLAIPDYAVGSADWGGTSSAFGACLHTLSSGTPAWPLAGAGNCTPANPGNWRGIGISDDAVASAAPGAFPIAAFRFGLRTSSSQPAGGYVAGISFWVVAPAV